MSDLSVVSLVVKFRLDLLLDASLVVFPFVHVHLSTSTVISSSQRYCPASFRTVPLDPNTFASALTTQSPFCHILSLI